MGMIVSVAIIACSVIFGVAVLGGAGVAVKKAQLSVAVDAAALAGAETLAGYQDGDACANAARILTENYREANIESCDADETSGEVRIIAGVGSVIGVLHSRARAG